ncbi:VOC family protein [Streptomyces sp. NBC_01477]|uniref:VOC family protein n=1 Tax=Streptomyces sp. NBC_01477 TaxID=2976015 RepID=UPI003FCE0A92
MGRPLVRDQDQETAIRSPHGGPKITWGGPPLMPRTGGDRVRFDLAPPAGGDRQAEVDRLISLGATLIGEDEDEYEGDDDDEAGRLLMAGPDGYEFTVSTPRWRLPSGAPARRAFRVRVRRGRGWGGRCPSTGPGPGSAPGRGGTPG